MGGKGQTMRWPSYETSEWIPSPKRERNLTQFRGVEMMWTVPF